MVPIAALIFAAILVLVVIARSVKRVRPDERILVERMGAYRNMGGPGWNLILPFVESATVVSLKERLPEWKNDSEEEIAGKSAAVFYHTALQEKTVTAEATKSAAARTVGSPPQK